jgi:hypothetical protein
LSWLRPPPVVTAARTSTTVSKDWAQLFELSGLVATLVADLDQVYDLSLPDDRLILGVKGSISEYELTLFRQRSQQAIRAKAQRGALQFTLPAGLGWTPDGQIELHPDRRVQQAIRMVFDKLLRGGAALRPDRRRLAAGPRGPRPARGAGAPASPLGRERSDDRPAVCPARGLKLVPGCNRQEPTKLKPAGYPQS